MYIRKQWLLFPMRVIPAAVREGGAVAGNVSPVLFDDVMIAVEHVEPVLPVEQGEQLEYIAVCLDNLCETAVFPKLVAVAQLDVCKACLIVVLQSSIIEMLVFQEIVVGRARAPVTVADQNVFCAGVEGKPRRPSKD